VGWGGCVLIFLGPYVLGGGVGGGVGSVWGLGGSSLDCSMNQFWALKPVARLGERR